MYVSHLDSCPNRLALLTVFVGSVDICRHLPSGLLHAKYLLRLAPVRRILGEGVSVHFQHYRLAGYNRRRGSNRLSQRREHMDGSSCF